ncbi:MAG TPA: MTH938/NDUFAF3 family protein [Nocardioidaceae bacterium]|jgi:hypothetical protein
MDVRLASFGAIEAEGQRYEHDIVVDHGVVRKRSKGPSKAYRGRFGHTPLSVDETLPWDTDRLIIGTGAYGSLPVMAEVSAEAEHRGIELITVPTEEACRLISSLDAADVCAVLHVTC